MRSGYVVLAAALLALAAPRVRAGDFCSTCEIQLGVGGTYHWVGYSHGIVYTIRKEKREWTESKSSS